MSDTAAKVLIAETAPDFHTGAPAVVTTGELDRGEPRTDLMNPPRYTADTLAVLDLHQRDDRGPKA